MTILLGEVPGGLPVRGEADIWHRWVLRYQRRWRSMYGPSAPKRKRPRRIQRKIDARGGAAKYQHAVIHRLLAEVTRGR